MPGKNAIVAVIVERDPTDLAGGESGHQEVYSRGTPSLGNATVASILDELGLVKEAKAQVEKHEKFLVAAFKARAKTEDGNPVSVDANLFDFTLTSAPRKSFSVELAKQFMTPEEIEACYVENSVETLRVIRK